MITGRSVDQDSEHPNLQAIGYGLILSVLLVMLAYPLVGIMAAVAQRPGMPTSPALCIPVLWVLGALVVRGEPWLQTQRWWSPRVENQWYNLTLGVGFGLPWVVGFVWPRAVAEGSLEVGMAAIFGFLPIMAAVPGVMLFHRIRNWLKR